MANILIDPLDFIKVVDSGAPGAVDTFISEKFKDRGSTAIKPSIPGKYDPSTGKIVLMDLVEHSQQVGKLLESGIIPLSEGYIYIDENAYNILTSKNIIESDKAFGSMQSELKSVTSAPNKLYNVKVSDAIKNIREKEKADPFVIALGKKATYNYFQPANTAVYNDPENKGIDIAIEAAKKYINTNTVKDPGPGKYQKIKIYFSSLSNMTPTSESAIAEVYVKNKTESLTSEEVALSKLIGDKIEVFEVPIFTSKAYEQYNKVEDIIIDTQAAGHLEAVKTTEVRELLKAFRALEENDIIKNHSSHATVLKIIEVLEEDVKELDALDKFFSNANAYYNPNLEVYFQNLVAGASQLGMDVSFTYATEQGLKTDTKAYLNFLFEINGISTPESSLINSAFKGNRTGIIVGRIRKAWTVAADRLAQELALDRATIAPFKESSQSLVQALLTKALGKIFGVSVKVDLTKKKKAFIVINTLYKKNKKLNNIKMPKVLTAKVSKSKSRLIRRNILSKPQTTQNIVPLINAELKRYVLEQMTYPSLENRSETFARSVRVLSAQENAAVQYTYQKAPYQVFSPSKGKRPWATEERDPAKIIDRAIKKLGQDRFQKVFRTEER